MAHYHAIVWIDHREARVFHFSAAEADELVNHPDRPTRHLHHKANSIGSGHAPEDHAFLQRVTESIADAGAVLITERLIKEVKFQLSPDLARFKVASSRRMEAITNLPPSKDHKLGRTVTLSM